MADSDNTTSGKPPAFQFYPTDFVNGTVTLTTEEVGAYMLLMCYCWDKGSIPSDLCARARITRLTPQRMRRVWAALASKFDETPDGFTQPRIERERQKQADYRRRQSDASRKRWDTRGTPKPHAEAIPVHMPADMPTASSSAFNLQSSSPKKDLRASSPTDEIAAELMEQYPAVFARCRGGATYRTSRVNMDRDLENCRVLAQGWPSLPRLIKMLEVFLTTDKIGDKNMPGTPGQFLHMAPELDALLRRNGK